MVFLIDWHFSFFHAWGVVYVEIDCYFPFVESVPLI